VPPIRLGFGCVCVMNEQSSFLRQHSYEPFFVLPSFLLLLLLQEEEHFQKDNAADAK
jgi:hypothetical protein